MKLWLGSEDNHGVHYLDEFHTEEDEIAVEMSDEDWAKYIAVCGAYWKLQDELHEVLEKYRGKKSPTWGNA